VTDTVVVLPCLPVGRAEVAEARRALAGQGRSVGDVDVTQLLWLSRALPALVELMASLSLFDAVVGPAHLELGAPAPPRAPLAVVAWRHDDEHAFEVAVVTCSDLELRIFDNAVAWMHVPLHIPPRQSAPAADVDSLDTSDTSPVVRLQRFSFGSAGKSPS
jgi:hypothetical protein